MDVDREDLLGRTIAGKFALDAYIGGGAMGAVYRAKHVQLDTVVAIKVLHNDLKKDAQFSERFLREAKAAFRIDHPNSLRVIDYGEEPDGLLYIAMEHLDGRDLQTLIRKEWPLTSDRIADLLMQTLGALAAAHDLGILHRDLKPENIMVLARRDDEGHTREIVKVCDFGIAKMTEKAHNLDASGPKITERGMVVGTPEYMSPEQGRGEPLDARSDLYSIGVILYYMLTRTLPFQAETPIGILLKHVTDEPVPPSFVLPTVDARLEGICLRALRKRREERHGSAREMRADFRVIQTDLSSGASLTAEPAPTRTGSIPVPLARALDEDPGVTPTLLAPEGEYPSGSLPRSHTSTAGIVDDEPVVLPKRRATGLVLGSAFLTLSAAAVGYVATHWPSKVTKAQESAVAAVNSSPVEPAASHEPLVASNASGATPPAILSASTPPLPLGPRATDRKIPLGGSSSTVPSPVSPSVALPTAPRPSATELVTAPSTSATVGPNSSSGLSTSTLTAPADSASTYDPSKARVQMARVVGAKMMDARKVVPVAIISQCYREDLRGVTKRPAPFRMTLTLKTDEDGRVKQYDFLGNMQAQHPQDLMSCIQNNMTTAIPIAGITTASVVNVELTFDPG